MPRDERLYLDDIFDAVSTILSYVAGMDFDSFAADRKTVDAVVRNLEIIGEAARALGESTKACAPEIEWNKIIGLRNILAHQYFGVNTQIIWDIIQTKLPALKHACEKLLRANG